MSTQDNNQQQQKDQSTNTNMQQQPTTNLLECTRCDSLGSLCDDDDNMSPNHKNTIAPKPCQANGSSSSHSKTTMTTQTIQTRCVAGVQIASMFAEPSAYLQKVLRHKAASKPSELCRRHSRQGSFDDCMPVIVPAQRQDDLLHRACCSQETTMEMIQQILASDPLSASRPLMLSSSSSSSSSDNMIMMEDKAALPFEPTSHVATTMAVTKKASGSFLMESYMYPLNLAIHYGLSPQVLAALIRAAPQVLLLPDGPRHESSLHTLLRYSPHDTKTVLDMLLHQPAVASSADQQGNLPLHIACQFTATDDAIQYLCLVCPEARNARNQLGQTPNDLLMLYKTNGKECPAA